MSPLTAILIAFLSVAIVTAAWKFGHEKGYRKGFRHGENKTIPLKKRLAEKNLQIAGLARSLKSDRKQAQQRREALRSILTPEQWLDLHNGDAGRRKREDPRG